MKLSILIMKSLIAPFYSFKQLNIGTISENMNGSNVFKISCGSILTGETHVKVFRYYWTLKVISEIRIL